ncbi:coiled-coil-helix-coiled-coil-helix domain-containing protein 7-like [Dreissena polymorpha]|uniref:Coiled-coil-helix-coiled-coil-helix domain-containing protein 7 n=1 Tax=Dreissena polymorpha TaxID=45954 RepID=A0A9D3YDD3_DREPO|nr:coiled-coil-helix-coiled-coil-helix domain-containing protein 7-like [Dreissena polymorpha]KAH3696332.1 hypothetical protein DPMN_083795 [Dreissena polymorpha]
MSTRDTRNQFVHSYTGIKTDSKGNFEASNDPCLEEQRLYVRCKSDLVNYDQCGELAVNVKHCRKFWRKVQGDRRKKGIYPTVPDLKDRPKIIEEYRDILEKIQRQNTYSCVVQ